MLLSTNEKSQENRLRRLARRQGYRLTKSRAMLSCDNYGGYMIVDERYNFIVAGSRFELTLDDVEAWLEE